MLAREQMNDFEEFQTQIQKEIDENKRVLNQVPEGAVDSDDNT